MTSPDDDVGTCGWEILTGVPVTVLFDEQPSKPILICQILFNDPFNRTFEFRTGFQRPDNSTGSENIHTQDSLRNHPRPATQDSFSEWEPSIPPHR